MKTKKNRKITHRKHYRKKNIIKSKKLHKSTRRNNKKHYGGKFLADFDMSPYTIYSFNTMISSLQKLINDNVELYKDSILDVILKDIIETTINTTVDKETKPVFDTFPELIKLILKLEVKPSNALEFIYFILGFEKDKDKDKEELKTQLKDFLDEYPGLIKFIDKNRSKKETEDYDVGWSLLSSLVVGLIEIIDTADYFGFDLKKRIKIAYNKDSIIQCGLMDIFLDNNDFVNQRDNKTRVNIFYDSFSVKSNVETGTLRRDIIRRDNVRQRPLKTIYDFLDKDINKTGIMPPFVLLILSLVRELILEEISNPHL